MSRLEENDPIFDGFAHRGFNESIDGWRNELPDASYFECVKSANSVLYLFEELCIAKRRIWELENRLKIYKDIA